MHPLRLAFALSFVLNSLLRGMMCFLVYPSNSAYGLIAAIAVPLDLPHRNVFLSYNFEANYNLPNNILRPPNWENYEEQFPEARNVHSDEQCDNCTENAVSPSLSETTETADTTSESPSARVTPDRHDRSLISRSHFYYMMEDKIGKHGFPGKACLLRLICETNASELGQVNGVLGSLFHVLFTPSSSMYEFLPLEYYQAELDGQHEQCDEHYKTACKDSPLDFISASLDQILSKQNKN